MSAIGYQNIEKTKSGPAVNQLVRKGIAFGSRREDNQLDSIDFFQFIQSPIFGKQNGNFSRPHSEPLVSYR